MHGRTGPKKGRSKYLRCRFQLRNVGAHLRRAPFLARVPDDAAQVGFRVDKFKEQIERRLQQRISYRPRGRPKKESTGAGDGK
jgi:hypothetical protein